MEAFLTTSSLIRSPVITATLFRSEHTLSQSFCYLKKPVNTARFLWPVGEWIDGVPLYSI